MASSPTVPPAKVFVDSSVLIAAAISLRGSARKLLNAGILGHYQLFASQFVLTESERNITAKAPAALPMFQLFEEALAPGIVRPSRELVLAVGEIVELKDAPIVAGAMEAVATYLATYDQQHLVTAADRIRDAFGVSVATPSEILRLTGKDYGA
jgi:predicted nucleic acid-binding protein